MSDIELQDEGTIWLFRPLTQVGREWLKGNVQPDATWFGGALVVEHRYVQGLAEGAMSEGLTITHQ